MTPDLSILEGLEWMRRAAERHRPTRERGLRHFTVHPDYWDELGQPTHVLMSDGSWVEVRPTGKRVDRFRWYYKKRPR